LINHAGRGIRIIIEEDENPNDVSSNFPPARLDILLCGLSKINPFPDPQQHRVIFEVIEGCNVQKVSWIYGGDRDEEVLKEQQLEELDQIFSSKVTRTGAVVSWDKSKKTTYLHAERLTDKQLDQMLQDNPRDRSNKRSDRR